MPYRLAGYLLSILLFFSTGALAQPSDGGAPTLDFHLDLGDDLIDGFEVDGSPDLVDWAELSNTISSGGLGDCAACYPNPDVIDFPPLDFPPVDFPAATLDSYPNCLLQISPTGQIICEKYPIQSRGNDILPGTVTEDVGPVTAPPPPQISYFLTSSIMRGIGIDDLCAALARVHDAGEHECTDGFIQIGEDLVIEVAEESREDSEFTALVVGRGNMLSHTGPYESHLFNITFALRLDGQPRIVLFNSMPLYTTFDSLSMIRSDRIREDVKYIPRSEKETKLEPFHARIRTILRAMIDERVEGIRSASND